MSPQEKNNGGQQNSIGKILGFGQQKKWYQKKDGCCDQGVVEKKNFE